MSREHIEKCSPNSLDVLSAGCHIGANKDYDTYPGRTAQAAETELGQRVDVIAQCTSGGGSSLSISWQWGAVRAQTGFRESDGGGVLRGSQMQSSLVALGKMR